MFKTIIVTLSCVLNVYYSLAAYLMVKCLKYLIKHTQKLQKKSFWLWASITYNVNYPKRFRRFFSDYVLLKLSILE